MELQSELIRPSRNKHRSNAITAMRVIHRREAVTELEQKLASSKKQLLREEVTSFERRTAMTEKREQLECEELQSQQLFQANLKIRKSILSTLESDQQACQKLDEEQHAHLLEMQHLESDLTQLMGKLEFLQNYQNTISGVEGFDRVVSKFQELNQTWQNTVTEYHEILTSATKSTFQKGHQTDDLMRILVGINAADGQRAVDSCESADRNKTARNAQWQTCTMAESFKQHGHTYLAIVNLAAHLSFHPIARTLTNVGGSQANVRPVKSHKTVFGKKDELERVPSIEQINLPVQNNKERWRALAAAAMGDGRVQNRCETDASISSDMGRASDSVSIELENKLLARADNFSASPICPKQSVINQIAVSKLNFIEQILYDLTLIKDEIEFHTDPLFYNEPEHSFV